MRLLITGAAGFIGTHFAHWTRQHHPLDELVLLDALTYAAHPESLQDILQDHCRLIQGSILNKTEVEAIFIEGVDAVVHFAAESHVDRSLNDPALFVETNVLGTQVLLDASIQFGVKRFIQVSTDEVYGSLDRRSRSVETDALRPSSPYSASKASADLLVLAYARTFGLSVSVTRCCNNYGPWQAPEKLIPRMVRRALAGQALQIYGDGSQRREWIHVADHVAAVDRVLRHGQPSRIYNIGSGVERSNLEVVHRIRDLVGSPTLAIEHVTDRPGHDWRYALDSNRIRAELGWTAQIPFEEGLLSTVRWYQAHPEWAADESLWNG